MVLWADLLFIAAGFIGTMSVRIAGSGSSLVILPTLIFVFSFRFQQAISLKMAVATALACAFLAGIVSMFSHLRIDRQRIVPSLFIGLTGILVVTEVVGASVAHYLPHRILEAIVVVLLLFLAARLLFSKAIQQHDKQRKRIVTALVAVVAASFNSLAAIPIGTIMVPYLLRTLPHPKAAANSIASGLVACAAGAATYGFLGSTRAQLPAHTWGYLYLPAFVSVAIGIFIALPVGHLFAEKVKPQWIKLLLVFLLLLAAFELLFG
jgi:uncharacterized membrane protein YfcA